MFRSIRFLTLAAGLLAAQLAIACNIRLATLNCYECFSPQVAHRGVVAKQHPLSNDQYATKVANLSTLFVGADFVALQEVGGREEIQDLAKAGGYEWAFAAGKDTYTGEEVGALYHLPGWKVTVNGRVGALDKALSKHLVVTARNENEKVVFLVVHLIRPMQKNTEKHERQIAAIRDWVQVQLASNAATAVIVLGDTNHPESERGSTIYGDGQEVADLTGFAPTHLRGETYDRIARFGVGQLKGGTIIRPPYGNRPNDTNKHLWTDHFGLQATLVLPPLK